MIKKIELSRHSSGGLIISNADKVISIQDFSIHIDEIKKILRE